MTLLKANFPLKKGKPKTVDRKSEAFEKTVLEHLGGSIVYVKGRKLLYEET